MDAGRLGYLAGFFDGEGSVSILRNEPRRVLRQSYKTPCHYLSVAVVQIDPRPLALFQEAFGGKVKYITRRQKGARSIYQWTISGQPAGDFLSTMLPYLVVKQRDAEIGIAFRSLMNRTKRHGVSPTDETIAARDKFRHDLIVLHNTGSRALKRKEG